MAIDFFSELNRLAPGAVGSGRDKRPSPTTQPGRRPGPYAVEKLFLVNLNGEIRL